MTIKARLILSTAVLLCLATVVIGVVAIGAVTTAMTGQVDSRLREYQQNPTAISVDATRPSNDLPNRYQPVAMVLVTDSGRQMVVSTAGFTRSPESPPALPSTLPTGNTVVTVPSEDGSTRYRLIAGAMRFAIEQPDSTMIHGSVVIAAPLTEVDSVRDDLIVIMIATVVVIAGLSITAGWWITRRGLRPVEDMIATAAAIADGDLTRRARPDRTEMGRLATALNAMVSKLVHAIHDREQGQVRLRRFIADASHELRTPLSTVSGYTQLYHAGGAPPGAALDRAMDRIDAENQRMSRLVEDLLLLARLDENVAPVTEPCDLSGLARDCAEDAATVDPDHRVITRITPAVTVYGDEFRLRQVVSNLLTNARQHTPPGTDITVGVSLDHGWALLSVSDTGPGIAPEHQGRVFDRLYRVDESRSRATGGSGLGLSIVASIVAMHGGRVRLDSTPGVGTTIHVALPGCTVPPAPEPGSVDAVDSGSTLAPSGVVDPAGTTVDHPTEPVNTVREDSGTGRTNIPTASSPNGSFDSTLSASAADPAPGSAGSTDSPMLGTARGTTDPVPAPNGSPDEARDDPTRSAPGTEHDGPGASTGGNAG